MSKLERNPWGKKKNTEIYKERELEMEIEIEIKRKNLGSFLNDKI